MSKRKSQTAVADYIAEGFIREALVNYLALLGWSTGHRGGGPVARRDRRALRPRPTVHKGGAVFDRERLEWLNGQWIRRLDAGRPRSTGCGRSSRRELAAGRIDRMPADDELRALLPIVQRAAADARRDRRPRRLPVGRRPRRSTRRCSSRSAGTRRRRARRSRGRARRSIADAGAVTFEADELEPPLRALAEARGWKAGDLFMAIRVAVTGRTATPPLFDTLVALGRERTLARLDAAIDTRRSARLARPLSGA